MNYLGLSMVFVGVVGEGVGEGEEDVDDDE
jgi:hypothetical protein